MDNVAKAIQEFVNNALGVNPIEMLIQIASTLLLFFIVKRYFWGNITEYLDKRKEAMNEEYEKANLASKEASLLKETAVTELQEIRANAKGLYDDAKNRGEEERKQIVEKARKEANKLVDNAHLEISSEIEKARKNMNDEIVSVATLMAEQIIKKELDEDMQKELIKEISKEVIN